jgi:hypothetical protein
LAVFRGMFNLAIGDSLLSNSLVAGLKERRREKPIRLTPLGSSFGRSYWLFRVTPTCSRGNGPSLDRSQITDSAASLVLVFARKVVLRGELVFAVFVSKIVRKISLFFRRRHSEFEPRRLRFPH